MKPKTLAILTAAAIGTATTFTGLEHLTCDHTERVCLITSLMNYIDQDSPIPYGIMNHQAPEISKELRKQGIENPYFYLSEVPQLKGEPSAEEPQIITDGKNTMEIYPEGFYVVYDEEGMMFYHGIEKDDNATISYEMPYIINETAGLVSYFYPEEGFFITFDPKGEILSHGILETAIGLVMGADQEFDGASKTILEDDTGQKEVVYQKTLLLPTKK